METQITSDYPTANGKGFVLQGSLRDIVLERPAHGARAAPRDIPSTALEWMKTAAYPTGAWYGDLGELGTTAFRDALFTGYLALGVTCKVSGVPYSWGGVGWAEAGGGLTPYADYATLSAQAPTVGKIAQIPRLCGNGYFALRGNGTRWEVCPGESIVRDAGVASAGYDLTATGTAYVPLASYTIPAGLIGDGEEWEADCFAIFTTFVSGSSTLAVRLAANVITSQSLASAANRAVRSRGAFPRLGTTLQIRNNAATDIYSGGITDVSVDLGLNQTIDAGISMGAVGNVGRLRQWTFRRIG